MTKVLVACQIPKGDVTKHYLTIGSLGVFFLLLSTPGVSLRAQLSSDSVSPELEPGVYVEDDAEIAGLVDRYQVSEEEARAMSQFEQVAVFRVADAIYEEFPDDLITTSADPANRLLVLYVSGNSEAVEARARSLMGEDGLVEVRAGFLPLEEVRGYWSVIEGALIDGGLTTMGALRPNEIKIWVDDIPAAEAIIEHLSLPPQLNIVFQPTNDSRP